MRFANLIVCFWLLVCAGCGPTPPGGGTWAQLTVNSYKFAIEESGVSNTSISSNTFDDGQGAKQELVEIKSGPNHLRVENGVLTVNGQPKGTLKNGDSVRVDLRGNITVNAQPR
ncbi:MAG: hypothetical protein SFX18_16245 [Pirellulales bacterium]|nr:hypothetical protein [Pirellulales bacterium]